MILIHMYCYYWPA